MATGRILNIFGRPVSTVIVPSEQERGGGMSQELEDKQRIIVDGENAARRFKMRGGRREQEQTPTG